MISKTIIGNLNNFFLIKDKYFDTKNNTKRKTIKFPEKNLPKVMGPKSLLRSYIFGNKSFGQSIVIKNVSKLVIFQEMLSEIPNWNQSIITNETNRIKDNISYIEDLLTAVFISNMRLLCSVENTNKKIKVKIPKLDLFIHV